MPTFDFSTPLERVNATPMSGFTAGLPVNMFDSVEDWRKPLSLAGILEPILLLTVGRDDEGELVHLTRRDKLDRFALNLKLRDGGPVEIGEAQLSLLRKAIEILPTEAFGVITDLFKNATVDEP